MRTPPFVVVGHISKPHGTKGEVFVWPLTDHPETTFVPGVRFLVADPQGSEPDGGWDPLEIGGVRPFKRGFLVAFRDVLDREGADLLHGRYLLRPMDELEPLSPDELFHHQLVGLRVLLPDGTLVGSVLEVYEARPLDLLEVARGGDQGPVLIPFHRDIVLGWDLDAGTLTVNPPDGLLDL